MKSNTYLLAVVWLAGAFGTGCQTYKPPIESWRSGNFPEAAKQFTAKAEKNKDNKDTIIWRLEQGTALRAAGQYQESIAAFDTAEEKINISDEKAKVSVSGEMKALLSNQATLPYEGRDYDRVMMNAYKALNFIQLGEPDKARVELIRASQRQQDAEENNRRRIEKAEVAADKQKEAKDDKGNKIKGADQGKEMADKAKADPKFREQVITNYGYLDGFKAKANYVNPFVYYLDALFFMTAGVGGSDLERARDSFRFTLGSIGENKFIKQDLEMFDQVLQGSAIPPTTYVIFETGCAPSRDQIRIDIPLFLVGARDVPYVGAAFPTLKFQEGNLPSLNVAAGGTNETTVLLASMDRVVGQAFKNELPTVITKTLISTAVKAAVAYGINKGMENQNAWAKLFVKILIAALQASVNIADTRTWNTLPKEFQFCRIPTPEDRKIVLSGPGGMPRSEVTVGDGTVNLIYVKSMSATNALLVTQIKLNGSAILTTNLSPVVTSFTPAAVIPETNATESLTLSQELLGTNAPTGSVATTNNSPNPTLVKESAANTSTEAVTNTPGKLAAANPVGNSEVEKLCAALKSENPNEIIGALKRLREMDAPEAVPKIIPCLDPHFHPNVIRDACRTLAVLGNKEVIPSIEPLLKHRKADVRKDARNAIAKLQAKP